MKIKNHLLRMLLLPILLLALIPQSASAQTPVVRALLFFSPTCPVCHDIMNNFLPVLMPQYGEQLQILNVDVTTATGQSLYQQAIEEYGITENRLGVPTIIVGQAVLVGLPLNALRRTSLLLPLISGSRSRSDSSFSCTIFLLPLHSKTMTFF